MDLTIANLYQDMLSSLGTITCEIVALWLETVEKSEMYFMHVLQIRGGYGIYLMKICDFKFLIIG